MGKRASPLFYVGVKLIVKDNRYVSARVKNMEENTDLKRIPVNSGITEKIAYITNIKTSEISRENC